MDNVYITRPGSRGKAEIVNRRPWSIDPVIEALRDPWIARFAADALAEVIQQHPDLGVYGWGISPPLIGTVDEPASVACFAIASAWCQRLERSTTCGVSSYAMKHVLENESGLSFYCPNGIFIAAAISVGIAQRRATSNSLLGLKLPPNGWEWRIWAAGRG